MRNSNGFTLTELMVVIAIVALLAAIAMPGYKSYMIKSNLATLMPLGSIMMQEASEKYYTDGAFPTMSDYSVEPISAANGVLGWWTDEPTGCAEANGTNGDYRGEYAIRFRLNSDIIAGMSNADLCFSATVSDSQVTWVCTTPASDMPNQSIPEKYLPAGCVYPG